MEEGLAPGLSIAIIQDAKLRWRRGFGVKDSASKKTVDNDTMFEIGVDGQAGVCYAVMKLCEEVSWISTQLSPSTPLSGF
jgi:hypothetical protein